MTDYSKLNNEQMDALKRTGLVLEGSLSSIDFLVDSYLMSEKNMTIAEIRSMPAEEKEQAASEVAELVRSHPVNGEVEGGADAVKANLEWFGSFFKRAIDRIKTSNVKFPARDDYENIDTIKNLESGDFMYAAEYSRRFALYTESVSNHVGIGRSSDTNKYGIDMGLSFMRGFGKIRDDNEHDGKVTLTNEYLYAREMNFLTTLRSFSTANRVILDENKPKSDRAIIKAVTETRLLEDLEGKDVSTLDLVRYVTRGEINLSWLGVCENKDRFKYNTDNIYIGKDALTEEEADKILRSNLVIPYENDKDKSRVANALLSDTATEQMVNCHSQLRMSTVKKITDDIFVRGDHSDVYKITDPEDDRINLIDANKNYSFKDVRLYKNAYLEILSRKFDEVFAPVAAYENPIITVNDEKEGHLTPYNMINQNCFSVSSQEGSIFKKFHIQSGGQNDNEIKENAIKQLKRTKVYILCRMADAGDDTVIFNAEHYTGDAKSVVKDAQGFSMQKFRTEEEAAGTQQDDENAAKEYEERRVSEIIALEKAASPEKGNESEVSVQKKKVERDRLNEEEDEHRRIRQQRIKDKSEEEKRKKEEEKKEKERDKKRNEEKKRIEEENKKREEDRKRRLQLRAKARHDVYAVRQGGHRNNDDIQISEEEKRELLSFRDNDIIKPFEMPNYSSLNDEQLEGLRRTGLVAGEKENPNMAIDFLVDSYLLAKKGLGVKEIRDLNREQKQQYAGEMADELKKHPVTGEVDGGEDTVRNNVAFLADMFAKALDNIRQSGITFPEKKDYADLKAINNIASTDFSFAADFGRRFMVYTSPLKTTPGKDLNPESNKYGIDRKDAYMKAYADIEAFNEDTNFALTLQSFAIAGDEIMNGSRDARERAAIKATFELRVLPQLAGKKLNELKSKQAEKPGEEDFKFFGERSLAWIGGYTGYYPSISNYNIYNDSFSFKEEPNKKILNSSLDPLDENADPALKKVRDSVMSGKAENKMLKNLEKIRKDEYKEIDHFLNGEFEKQLIKRKENASFDTNTSRNEKRRAVLAEERGRQKAEADRIKREQELLEAQQKREREEQEELKRQEELERQEEEFRIQDEKDDIVANTPDPKGGMFDKPLWEKVSASDFFETGEEDVVAKLKAAGFSYAEKEDIRSFIMLYMMGEKNKDMNWLYSGDAAEKKQLGLAMLGDIEKYGKIGEAAKDLDKNKAEEGIVWYGKMLQKAVGTLKKEGLIAPDAKQFGSLTSVKELKKSKVYAAAELSRFMINARNNGLLFDSHTENTQENPNGINQEVLFKKAYGRNYYTEMESLLAIHSIATAETDICDESIPLERRVKQKLMAEFALGKDRIFKLGKEMPGDFNRNFVVGCGISDFTGFSGMFSKEEMEKIISTPVSELDMSLRKKAAELTNGALKRSWKRDDYEQRRNCSLNSLEKLSGFAKKIASDLIREEKLGDEFAGKEPKTEADHYQFLNEIASAFRVQADKALKTGYRELSVFLNSVGDLCDPGKVNIDIISENYREFLLMLDSVSKNPILAPHPGKSMIEAYENSLSDVAGKEKIHKYMGVINDVISLLKEASAGDRSVNYDEKILSKLEDVKKSYNFSSGTGLKLTGIDISLKMQETESSCAQKGWKRKDSKIASVITGTYKWIKAISDDNRVLANNGDQEAIKNKDHISLLERSAPRIVPEEPAMTKNAAERIHLIRSFQEYISRYGNDPVFDGIRESFADFNERAEKALETYRKEAIEELNKCKDSDKLIGMLLKLSECTRFGENTVLDEYVSQMDSAALLGIYEKLMDKEGKDMTNVFSPYGRCKAISEKIEDSKAPLGGIDGLGMFGHIKERLLYDSFLNKYRDPLDSVNSDIFTSIILLRRKILKSVPEEQLESIEGKYFEIKGNVGSQVFEALKKFDADLPPYPIRIRVEENTVEIENPDDMNRVALQEAMFLEPEINRYVDDCKKIAEESKQLLDGINGIEIDGMEDARNRLREMSVVDDMMQPGIWLNHAVKLKEFADKLKDRKADADLIKKLDAFVNKALGVFSEKKHPLIPSHMSLKGLRDFLKKAVDNGPEDLKDQYLKEAKERREKLEQEKKAREKEEQRIQLRQKDKERINGVKEKQKAISDKEKELSGYPEDSDEYLNLLDEIKSLSLTVYASEKSAYLEGAAENKMLGGGTISFEDFAKTYLGKSFKSVDDIKLHDRNVLSALFDLLPENTDKAFIDELVKTAPLRSPVKIYEFITTRFKEKGIQVPEDSASLKYLEITSGAYKVYLQYNDTLKKKREERKEKARIREEARVKKVSDKKAEIDKLREEMKALDPKSQEYEDHLNAVRDVSMRLYVNEREKMIELAEKNKKLCGGSMSFDAFYKKLCGENAKPIGEIKPRERYMITAIFNLLPVETQQGHVDKLAGLYSAKKSVTEIRDEVKNILNQTGVQAGGANISLAYLDTVSDSYEALVKNSTELEKYKNSKEEEKQQAEAQNQNEQNLNVNENKKEEQENKAADAGKVVGRAVFVYQVPMSEADPKNVECYVNAQNQPVDEKGELLENAEYYEYQRPIVDAKGDKKEKKSEDKEDNKDENKDKEIIRNDNLINNPEEDVEKAADKEKARLVAKTYDQLRAVRLNMLANLKNAKNELMTNGRKTAKLYKVKNGEQLTDQRKEELFKTDGSVYYRRMAKALNSCIDLLSDEAGCTDEKVSKALFELENRAIQYQSYNSGIGGSMAKHGSGRTRLLFAEQYEKNAATFRMQYKYLNNELENLSGSQGKSLQSFGVDAAKYKKDYGFEDYRLANEKDNDEYERYNKNSEYRSRFVNALAGKDNAVGAFFKNYSPSMNLDECSMRDGGPRTIEEKAKWVIYKRELDKVFDDSCSPEETLEMIREFEERGGIDKLKKDISALKKNPVFINVMGKALSPFERWNKIENDTEEAVDNLGVKNGRNVMNMMNLIREDHMDDAYKTAANYMTISILTNYQSYNILMQIIASRDEEEDMMNTIAARTQELQDAAEEYLRRTRFFYSGRKKLSPANIPTDKLLDPKIHATVVKNYMNAIKNPAKAKNGKKDHKFNFIDDMNAIGNKNTDFNMEKNKMIITEKNSISNKNSMLDQ